MSSGSKALAAAAVLLLATIALRANEPAGSRPRDLTISQPPSDYLGSQSCERCHQKDHAQWKNSLHIQMTRPVAEAKILGNFSDGTKFADHDRSYTFGITNDKPYVSVSFGGRPAETYVVDYTLGAKRYQGYLSTLPDGQIYVLPVFWHVESQRWIDWKEITPIPDGGHDFRQIWNANCFNCHATNLVQGYDVAARTYQSTWTEMGIGCEACHGPGRDHVALMEAWEANPASKPAYDTSDQNRQLSGILKTRSIRSSEPRRIYDTCAYCHGNKKNAFVGFKAGDRYEDYATPFLLSDPIPASDLQGEFWPDGRPNRFNRSQALAMSGCFNAGVITCTTCHVAHGSPNDFSLKVNIHDRREGDALCTQCHSIPRAPWTPEAGARRPSFTGPGLEQHTFHKADSTGSRCINCHMSDVNWRLLTRRRDHTFQPPVPENTVAFGIPNACTACHDDRPPEWAAQQMNEWWGDGARRASAASLADIMYRAGSGDATTLPALAKLAVDRSHSFIIRASAADYVGRLVQEARGFGRQRRAAESQTSFRTRAGNASPARMSSPDLEPRTASAARFEPVPVPIVNAMIGAANDPEPSVRAAAVRSLGIIGDRDRSLGAVLARLIDPARIVRARAAEVLESFGILELSGLAGEKLRSAQEEWVSALRTFPDSASAQATLAWFESQRGNLAASHAAVDAAIGLSPSYAYAWVVKGVLSAREGKFADAVEMWKKARSIEPSYPNIDQLIAEGEKRK